MAVAAAVTPAVLVESVDVDASLEQPASIAAARTAELTAATIFLRSLMGANQRVGRVMARSGGEVPAQDAVPLVRRQVRA